jgi:hypothetical protein
MASKSFFLRIHKNELIFSRRVNSGKTVMNLRGRVIKKILYAGTKSEHEGLVLVTAEGEFKLQRKGGNPFWDETLAEFEGKEIEAEGTLKETRFIMSQWTVLS